MEAAKAAEMRARKERRVEEERRTLLKHLELQDGRLKQRTMMKQAAREKRIAEAFDPTPVRRKMYDDQMLEVAAQVPGPGTCVPGLWRQEGVDRQDVRSGAGTLETSSVIEINGTPGYDMSNTETWKLLQASRQPGLDVLAVAPAARGRHDLGLPPEQLKGGKESIPSAHDMGKMVSHLKGLPGPARTRRASPRRAGASTCGRRRRSRRSRRRWRPRRRSPDRARTTSTRASRRGTRTRSPAARAARRPIRRWRSRGTCRVPCVQALLAAQNVWLAGMGPERAAVAYRDDSARVAGKRVHDRIARLPCVACTHYLLSLCALQQQTKPGPGAYHPTPTFAEELETQRYLRSVARGATSPTRGGKLAPLSP